jgi:hypothetical protein
MQNPKLLDDAPHRVIYSELLNPEANKGLPTPTELQLCHEARVLFAAGSHAVGTTLTTGVYHLLRSPEIKQRLVDEVRTAWPALDEPPSHEELEKLPFLVSVIICQTRACFKDGTECCRQRVAAHRCASTRWPSSCSSASRCRNIWRWDTRRSSCFNPFCHCVVPYSIRRQL